MVDQEQAQSFYLDTEDNHQIFVRQWNTPQSVKGWIHILHGMVEHCGRYAHLAEFFNQCGYNVVSHDHRGHGFSVADKGDLGHYADKQGWEKLSRDVHRVQQHIDEQSQQGKRILLGHSMGSYIAQQYAMLKGDKLDALVLSGSTSQPQMLLSLLKFVIGLESTRQGPRGKSWLVDKLVFGQFNQKFKPAKTDFDWLSRDPEQVARYVNDELCGYQCTNETWSQMISGLKYISNVNHLQQMQTDLPVLIIGGDKDPVSDQGQGLKRLYGLYQQAGFSDVCLTLYPEGRHELFNETNKQRVMHDLISWLEEKLG